MCVLKCRSKLKLSDNTSLQTEQVSASSLGHGFWSLLGLEELVEVERVGRTAGDGGGERPLEMEGMGEAVEDRGDGKNRWRRRRLGISLELDGIGGAIGG